MIKLSNRILKDDPKVLDEAKEELKVKWGVNMEYESNAKIGDAPVDKWVDHKDSFVYKADIEIK